MAFTRDQVAREIEAAHDKLFTKLDDARGDEQKPSDLAKLLDADNWGLGDEYREWYEQGDEPWE